MKTKSKLDSASIEAAANSLLVQYAIQSAPVDVAAIARTLGVTVHLEQLEDEVSGMLLVKNKEKHIIVNKGHHSNRRRFTVAHELGHLRLHYKQGDEVYVDTKLMVYHRSGRSQDYSHPHATTTPQQEKEANSFASALLMPRSIVESFVDSHGIDVFDEFDLSKLAQAFEVSEQAMYIRLNTLKLVQAIF
jgi:Zn-dependent peptidase ImmA (M78 family)